jgi:prepilin-type N-terminal cleavage/methylation domain-containing protein
MNKHRVKAFTIIEMTVAMLISAIVIAFTYTAYSILSKSYAMFVNKNRDMETIIQLDRLLRKDFSKAASIYRTENGLTLKDSSSMVSYEMNESGIIRKGIVPDTFKVQISQPLATFENRPIATSVDDSSANLIDDFSFILLFRNEKIPYHYHKSYSSANLIQIVP